MISFKDWFKENALQVATLIPSIKGTVRQKVYVHNCEGGYCIISHSEYDKPFRVPIHRLDFRNPDEDEQAN